MIDIAWSEFLFISLVALILIGPKELPFVLRNVGRWIGKARAFTRAISAQLDFHAQMNDPPDDLSQEKRVVQNNEPPVETKTKPLENIKP